jgi:hypothetical protein
MHYFTYLLWRHIKWENTNCLTTAGAGLQSETYLRPSLPKTNSNRVLDSLKPRPKQDYQSNLFRASLEELVCEPAGIDKTGRVAESAYLTISAPFIRVSWTKPSTTLSDGNRIIISKKSKVLEFVCDCREDFEDKKFYKKRSELACLWIGSVWDGDQFYPYLLVLRESVGIGGRAATADAYEKVGVLYRK